MSVRGRISRLSGCVLGGGIMARPRMVGPDLPSGVRRPRRGVDLAGARASGDAGAVPEAMDAMLAESQAVKGTRSGGFPATDSTRAERDVARDELLAVVIPALLTLIGGGGVGMAANRFAGPRLSAALGVGGSRGGWPKQQIDPRAASSLELQPMHPSMRPGSTEQLGRMGGSQIPGAHTLSGQNWTREQLMDMLRQLSAGAPWGG